MPYSAEVRLDAVQRLRAAQGHAQAAHDFIENEQGAVLRAQFAHRLQEFRRRFHQVHIACHRFDDDAGDVRAEAVEGVLQLFHVVIVEHQGVFHEVFRHAGRRRVAEGEQAAARFHQQRIGVAVVAAFELDDLVASRGAARQAQGAHGRFRARRDQAHLLDRRHQARDFLGHQHFAFRWRAERQAQRGRILHRLDHFRMGVADDGRAPRADVVDIALAVRVPEIRAFGARDEARRAADGAEGAHGRIDAAWRGFLCAGKQDVVL